MLEPYIPQERIIPSLVQEKLPAPSQTWINFAVLVKVRSIAPAAIACMEVKHGAFPDVDKKPN